MERLQSGFTQVYHKDLVPLSLQRPKTHTLNVSTSAEHLYFRQVGTGVRGMCRIKKQANSKSEFTDRGKQLTHISFTHKLTCEQMSCMKM